MINRTVYFGCRPMSVGDAMLIMSEPEERRRQILAERNPEGKDA